MGLNRPEDACGVLKQMSGESVAGRRTSICDAGLSPSAHDRLGVTGPLNPEGNVCYLLKATITLIDTVLDAYVYSSGFPR